MAARIRSSYDLKAKTQQILSFEIWIEPKTGVYSNCQIYHIIEQDWKSDTSNGHSGN